MSITYLVRLFNKNIWMCFMSGFMLSFLMFLYAISGSEEYRSESILYTGLESGVGSMIGNEFGFGPTGNQYANLITEIEAQSTQEEIGMRLLATHLLDAKFTPSLLTAESYAQLDEWLPPSERKSLTVEGDSDATYRKILAYSKAIENSEKYRRIFKNSSSPYSHLAIENINVIRMATSDFVRMEYTWRDPGIAQSTLQILNDVIISKMGMLKMGKTNDIVMYFRQRVDETLAELQAAEDSLVKYKVKHGVISYGDQSGSIADKKDHMEIEQMEVESRVKSLDSSVHKLEQQLEVNKKLFKSSDEILAIRSRLAKISSKMAEMDIFYRDEAAKIKLKAEKEELTAELKKLVSDRWSFARTTEGLNTTVILDQWLQHSLELEEAKAMEADYEERKKYYTQQFDKLAVLGSEIEKRTRDIEIKESNYLEMLNSLNDALIRQKSDDLSMSNWVVTLEPTFPLEPLRSKKYFFILLGFIFGFLVPFGLVLLFDFLDQSLKTPERAKDLTGLGLLGAYPNMDEHIQAEKDGVDLKNISALSVGLLCQNFLLEVRKASWTAGEPMLVAVLSTEPGEGKARITHKMANELAMRGFNVLAVNYKIFEADGNFQYDRTVYDVDRNYLNVNMPEQMLSPEKRLEDYDFIFFQFPALLHSRFPVDVMSKMHMALMPAKANRVWSKADAQALKEVSTLFDFKPRLILNGTSYEDMEEVIGEIAKKRSALRKFVKKALSLQLRFRRGYNGNPLF